MEPILITSSAPEWHDSPLPESELAKLPKKRGRKKKEAAVDESAQSEGQEEAVPSFFPASDQRPKRKRGRPRKSEATTVTETVTGGSGQARSENSLEFGQLSETSKQPGEVRADKSGGKPGQPSGPAADSHMLREKSGNQESLAYAHSGKVPDAYVDSAGPGKENKPQNSSADTKEMRAGGVGEQAKVSFRVGLSKKSRIAPLLKSIRK